MAYNEELFVKLDTLLNGSKGFTQKKMFGGVGFLLNGNMCVGIYKDFLILRLGEELGEKALKKKEVKKFDITGRPMKGWVMIDSKDLKREDTLKQWVENTIRFVCTLAPKD